MELFRNISFTFLTFFAENWNFFEENETFFKKIGKNWNFFRVYTVGIGVFALAHRHLALCTHTVYQ